MQTIEELQAELKEREAGVQTAELELLEAAAEVNLHEGGSDEDDVLLLATEYSTQLLRLAKTRRLLERVMGGVPGKAAG